MKNTHSIKDKFEHIQQCLDTAPNYTAILESVKSIFREAKYGKRYHTVTLGGLFRATQNIEDTCVLTPFGEPVLTGV